MQISTHTCYSASRVTFLPTVYLACVYCGEGGCVHRLKFIKTVEVTHFTLTLKHLLFSLKHIPEVYGLSSQVIEQFFILIRQDET